MSNEELNKKLAEWAGFWYKPYKMPVYQDIEDHKGKLITLMVHWVYPDNCEHLSLPDFTESLDACFKWLVPKLCRVTIIQEFNSAVYAEIVVQPEYEYIHYKEWAETPALALCLAIKKLIDNKQ